MLSEQPADLLHDPWLRTSQADLDLDRRWCKFSLYNFVKEAWHVLEPAQIFTDGWVIRAICDHLQAITEGKITRLLINVPPGCMKSMLVSVFWQAWEWGPMGMPHIKFMGASYDVDLATRDARRLRTLVESEWFQARWPLKMAHDQNQKTRFENEKTGFRIARASISLTGERAHRLALDDPHSIKKAESPLLRSEVVREFREAAQSRMVDPKRSAIIVIMQRINEGDVSGWIRKNAPDYVCLILPMEFEVKSRCKTSIGFEDPRTYEGELLFEERFPRDVVERDKKIMGAYAVAGQFQQTPSPREGGTFEKSWFATVKAIPSRVRKRVRAWDRAGTTPTPGKDPDWTVGVLLAVTDDNHCFVEDVERFQGSAHVVDTRIKNVADQDRAKYGQVLVHITQDPGQAGKAQREADVRMLAGHPVAFDIASGSKITRATPVSSQAENGNVSLLEAPWNEDFLEELALFPSGIHDDQVDALADAFNCVFHPAAGESFLEYMRRLVEQTEKQAAEETATGPKNPWVTASGDAAKLGDAAFTLMIPPEGTTNASNRTGRMYSIRPDGLMRILNEDVQDLKRAGFKPVENPVVSRRETEI